MTQINRYKVKYSYNNASGNNERIEKSGCKMDTRKPSESELLAWAEHNTIGGGYDFKILSVSEPY